MNTTIASKYMDKGPKKQYKKERARKIRRAAKKNPENMPNRISNSFGVGGWAD